MNPTKLVLSGLLILSLMAPAAQARRFYGRRAVGTAVALGAIGAIASHHYYPGYYSYYGAPVYGAPVYGYARPYAARTALPFGATSFIDEGDYRNYYDAYGHYLGRTALWNLGY